MEEIKKEIIFMNEIVAESCVVNILKDFMKVMETEPEKVVEFFKYFDEREKISKEKYMKYIEEKKEKEKEEKRYELEHPEDPRVIEKKKREKSVIGTAKLLLEISKENEKII